MRIAPFTLERVQSEWEHRVRYNLSESGVSPLSARAHFAARAPHIIDLLAILPFYLGHIFGVDLRVLARARPAQSG